MQCVPKCATEGRVAKQHPTPLHTIWLRTLPKILILGFCIILIGAVLILVSAATGSSATGGVLLFIGPLPIILGAGSEASTVTLISTLIAVAIILLLLASYWKPRKNYA